MSQYPPPGQYPVSPPGNHPPPPGQPYWQESPKGKGMAVTALVLGILALLTCWSVVGGVLFGIFAIIFGLVALAKTRAGRAGGTGMAIGGLITGALGVIAGVLFGIVYWRVFEESGGHDFIDCVNRANGDQAKIEQCRREWNRTLENKYSITVTPVPTG
jgi:uncharacterized protein DUF4190